MTRDLSTHTSLPLPRPRPILSFYSSCPPSCTPSLRVRLQMFLSTVRSGLLKTNVILCWHRTVNWLTQFAWQINITFKYITVEPPLARGANILQEWINVMWWNTFPILPKDNWSAILQTRSMRLCCYEADMNNAFLKPLKASFFLVFLLQSLLNFCAPTPASWAWLHAGSISLFAHSRERKPQTENVSAWEQ